MEMEFRNFFFSSKGVFPKIWGHPTHIIGSTHTTLFFPSDESNFDRPKITKIDRNDPLYLRFRRLIFLFVYYFYMSL